MRVAVFSTKHYDRESLLAANSRGNHEFTFFEARLSEETARLAEAFPAVCIFVNDVASERVLSVLAKGGTKGLALRCAGFNQVDRVAAKALGIRVTHVPAYSPNAVAEHTIALLLALNRKIPKAVNRVREGNFSLEQLMGFDVSGKTVGVIGTGRIGAATARILLGFGCKLLLYDRIPSRELALVGEYVSLDRLYRESDIITLHCPLTPETKHLINEDSLNQMKRGVMLLNTSRGALIDTQAVINGLKKEHVGYLGIDVYEEEAELFFEDHSSDVLKDDVFARLLTFPNVIVTAHQAFFTKTAIEQIAATTIKNLDQMEAGGKLDHETPQA